MAMTKVSMAAKIRTAMALIPPSTGTAASTSAYSDAIIQAMCDGIIQEIHANAVVSSSVTIPTTGAAGSPSAGTATGAIL